MDAMSDRPAPTAGARDVTDRRVLRHTQTERLHRTSR